MDEPLTLQRRIEEQQHRQEEAQQYKPEHDVSARFLTFFERYGMQEEATVYRR
jgi:hypothetical protein